MSKIAVPSTQEPLVDEQGRPSPTMQRLLAAMVKRLNASAGLDPQTATTEQIVRALSGE
ncbi:MAG: hypothetical protein AAFQ35_07140 [Pseudomonadota bacterium]